MKKITCTILFSFGVFLIPSSILAKDTNSEMVAAKENVIQKFEADNGDLKEILKREITKAVEKYNAVSASAISTNSAGIEVFKYETDTEKVDIEKSYSAIAVILPDSAGNTVYKFESLNGDISLEEVQKHLISVIEKKY
ncbi:hypothetical protein [Lysinibacillus sp. RS5]|uniref:hypothetical protein n=1 Tax=unclassified Lysinibacillus TaxID=2636778 RepID=UPI0035BE62A9